MTARRYTTAELHALPDDTTLQDYLGFRWKPYFWQGKRTRGWITGEVKDYMGDYLPASELAKIKLELRHD